MATEAQCDACGELNASDAAFCLFCGAYLGWDAAGGGPAAATGATPSGSGAAPGPVSPSPPPTPPAPGSTGTPPPTPRVVPSTPEPREAVPPVTAGVPSAAAAQAGGCPACGHVNEPGRRFCGRCGQLLAPLPSATPRPRPQPTSTRRGWWLFGDSSERAARRAYRRSLPPLYRWRRVIVALLLLAAGVGLLAALAGDPVTWVRQRWYDVTGRTEPVEDVTAAAVPEGSVLQGYSLAGLVDKDPRTAWATRWADETVVSPDCGKTSGVGAVRLTWTTPVRLRGLEVRAGLDARESARDMQYRPTRLDVQLPDGHCVSGKLEDTPGWQSVELDSEKKVDSVVLLIGDATRGTAQPGQEVVAVSGVRLLVRPD